MAYGNAFAFTQTRLHPIYCVNNVVFTQESGFRSMYMSDTFEMKTNARVKGNVTFATQHMQYVTENRAIKSKE